MTSTALVGLSALVLIATGLALTVARLDRHVTATASAVERIRLLHLATATLRREAAATRARFDGTADTVAHLGRR